METVHISALTVTIVSGVLAILVAICAFFLSRLIEQLDKLQEQFGQLNNTMQKIDKDLSSDVGILKARLTEFDPIWDRLRCLEERVVRVESGGCEIHKSHCKGQ